MATQDTGWQSAPPCGTSDNMEAVLPLQDDDLFASVVQAFAGLFAPLDPAGTKPPVRLKSEYGRVATDEVLAATDVADLLERLDILGSDPRFWQAEVAATALSGPSASEKIATTSLDMTSLEATLGLPSAQKCQAGWEAFKAVFLRLEILAKRLDRTPAQPMDHKETPSASILKIVEMAYSLECGPTMRHVIHLTLRFLATIVSIARAEEHGKRLAPWLSYQLANLFADTPQRALRVMSDQTEWSEWVTQMTDDLGRISPTRRALEQWSLAAKSSGVGIFFPLTPDGRAVL